MDESTRSQAAGETISAPRVEVLVCVHNATRPVERAVVSALRNETSVRVTVVAHNTDPEAIVARLGTLAHDSRVRVLHLADGVRSPANAFNFGIENATGDFISLVGSDDELSPGALDAWVALADRAEAAVVVAPIRRVGSGAVPSPRVRPGRTTGLDGDRDRLFERTAPLGLFGRERFSTLRFTEGLPRGVDQAFGLHLWFSGSGVAFDPASPAYLEHDDQADRVTRGGGRVADDVAYLGAIEADGVFATMAAPARRAVAVKILRVHLVASIASHLGEDGLTDADRAAVVEIHERLRGWAPRVDGLLARRDARALKLAADPAAGRDRLRTAIGDRSRYLTPGALIPANPFLILHRHAPLRSLAAGRDVARRVMRAARA